MGDKTIYSSFTLKDMSVVFFREEGRVGYTLIPADLYEKIDMNGWWSVEPAAQFKIAGEPYPDGFIHGHSMKNGSSVWEAEFLGQQVEEKDGIRRILTMYKRNGLNATAVLEYTEGNDYLTAYTVFENRGAEKISLEMAASFNICAFPCVGTGLRQQDLVLHRMKSKWSMEGKLESRTFTDMELEPAWLRIGAASERFGEVGSMPVRRYFPWMIVSDNTFGYSIGAQLAINSSWQMEVYNKDEKNSLSGGIADREFGHWMKDLAPGEVFTTPCATLTVSHDDIDGISWRLTSAQKVNLENVPECERELPVIFNEYCTSWGDPTEEEMAGIAQKLKGHGIKYCVIDAGWHVKDGNDWSDIGDWIMNTGKFPGGLKKTADTIRECGMIPGIWYEMEVVGKDSDNFHREDLLLKRDGKPIQTALRRFLDMRDPRVVEFLDERLIKNLKDNGFGYLKVDYNDNLGIGCEGAESFGEALRLNMEASREYFRRIRREIPDIVIENCSSGGHRLEPSMQAVTSMASFSDAHEWTAIPVIAANVTRAILPAQSQIWAVLRKGDDARRLYYSLSNAFLGRMCLSGDIHDLSDEQWSIVDEAIGYYKKCAPVIKNGRNYRYGPFQNVYNDLRGWQAVCRVADDGKKALAVINSFKQDNGEREIVIPDLPLGEDPKGGIKITDIFARKGISVTLCGKKLTVSGHSDFDGLVVGLSLM